jgi:hypothetical protein
MESFRKGGTRASAAALALVSLAGLPGWGCNRECGLADKRITVALLAPYDETGPFEYYPHVLSGILGEHYPSCGHFYAPDTQTVFHTGQNLTEPKPWSCRVSAVVEGSAAPVEWVLLENIIPTSDVEWLSDDLFLWTHLMARGMVQWRECVGMYSIHLRGLETGPDYMRDPQPGEEPAWIVARLFEPLGECPDLGLPEGEIACADAWAARFDEIAAR